ncbi:MAG: hypothetical protein ABFD24_12220 [Anaerolineaceae bacterium]
MNPLIGQWQQPAGQPFPGLWFEFHTDGTFKADYSEMGITSSGTYSVSGDLISMDQVEHTLGLVGKFEGRFAIEGSTLKMALGNPGEKAPEDLSKARIYLKI